MSSPNAPVVVGYDGSEEGRQAVEWAALAAQRRSATLLVVSATGWSEPPAGLEGLAQTGEKYALALAKEGCGVANHMSEAPQTEAVGVVGRPQDALISLSNDAQLVVVGHRGAGALRLGVLGSVAFDVSNNAACPVAVVRRSSGALPTETSPSVVAVDGSATSLKALDLAAQWASESNSLLRIISVWRSPTGEGVGALMAEEASEGVRDGSKGAKNAAHQIVSDAKERVLEVYPGLLVESLVGSGRPSEVIVEASRGAALIVMGARGRGSLATLLLGSVSREVVEGADCAVYIVR